MTTYPDASTLDRSPLDAANAGTADFDPSLPTALLAQPRGFCAGVDRAIEIVDQAIDTFGAPIYVRHEVVHNRTVVDGLKQKGAIFIEE